MGVGCAQGNLAVLSPEGSPYRRDGPVGSCVSDQCREVRGLGLNSNDSGRRVLEREQNACHPDMSANVHDRVGAKSQDAWIIRLALEDQNVPVRTKIRRIYSEVDAVPRLKRGNSQFAWPAAQTKRSDRADTAASAHFVVPFQSLPKAQKKPRVKASILLRRLARLRRLFDVVRPAQFPPLCAICLTIGE